MVKSFLFLSMMLLFTGCCSKTISKPKQSTKHPTVHFSLDGNLFQMRLLSPTQSSIEDGIETTHEDETTFAISPEEEEEKETEEDFSSTVTQYAVVRVIPKTPVPSTEETSEKLTVKSDKTLKTFYKMKDLYEEFGKLLKQHEKQLLSLPKRKEYSPTAASADVMSIKDRNQVIISKDNAISVLNKDAYEGSQGLRKDGNNNLNIHVHADPPLRLRTIIGYPQSLRMGKITPLRKQQANIRIFERDTPSSTLTWDARDESVKNDVVDQELSSEQEAFLRRGLSLLLSMWERFQSRRMSSKPDEQEQPNFNEEFVSTDDMEPYNPPY